VASDLKRPAGLAFSPDCKTLYVSEIIQGLGGLYVYAYDVSYTDPKVPSFNISVVPSVKHAANGSSGSGSGSSTQSPAQYHQNRGYATPDSSPRLGATTVVGRSSVHSRSGSHTRSRDMSHHKFLASMTNGLRSPSQGPTSEPTFMDRSPQSATPFSSIHRKYATVLSNKRHIVYTPGVALSGAITTDPIHGDLWLGTEEGVEVWNPVTGELTGKIVVESGHRRSKTRGVSKVVFINDSEALLLGGDRVWRLRMGLRGLQAT
jgi:hypothetical protein